jgi:preprotein translocase subunit SecB
MMSCHIAHVKLLDYFVKSFSFETNMKCEKEKPRDLSDVTIQNNWRPLKKHKNRYAVFLNMEMRAPEGKNTPYAIKMEMFGYFQVPEEMPEELREKMVKTNGSSILYGAAREIIREMTSRGIFRKIYFPTVSFAPLDKKSQTTTTAKSIKNSS